MSGGKYAIKSHPPFLEPPIKFFDKVIEMRIESEAWIFDEVLFIFYFMNLQPAVLQLIVSCENIFSL